MRASEIGIDENRSVWLLGHEDYEVLPALSGDLTADVVIVGGGFAGVSAAWHLSARFPDRKIVLLEARTLANGASGRNGGQALNWCNGVGFDDEETVKRVFAATKAGLDWIDDTIRDHKLPVRWRREGSLEIYTDPRRADGARAHAEQLAAWGIPVRYLSGAELSKLVHLEGACGGVFDPTAGVLNGVDFLRALRPLLLARGVAIYENSPVMKVEEGATVTVTTDGGVVKAGAVVLAAGPYLHKLGYFKNDLFPMHSHALSVGPPSDGWDAHGWRFTGGICDDLDRIAYGSKTPDDHIVFGGGSNASYTYLYGGRTAMSPDEPLSKKGFDAVKRTLTGYMPDVAKLPITHHWTGALSITFNRRCAMGVRGDHKNVYYAIGFSGHGVNLANIAGKVICDLYSDHHEPWAKLPFYQPSLPWIPPEPLRWVGYKVVTGLTGKSPRAR